MRIRSACHRVFGLLVIALALCFACLLQPQRALAAASDEAQVIRLYNPFTHEHLYTTSQTEVVNLVKAGWNFEDVAWMAPKSSDVTVSRLYNRYNGGHLYTTSQAECDALLKSGWSKDSVKLYGQVGDGIAVHRLYNPYQTANGGVFSHLWTTDDNECQALKNAGWREESGGWLGVKNPSLPLSMSATEAFSKMVGSYMHTAGTRWAHICDIAADGSFEGSYSAPVTSRQMVYQTDYTGKFGPVLKLDDYTYVTSVASLNQTHAPGSNGVNHDPGSVYDGFTIEYIDNVGLGGGGNIYFYLKGKPMSSVPSEFTKNAEYSMTYGKNRSTLPCKGVYNTSNGIGLC